MSNEEIIQAWKNEQLLGKKPAKATHSTQEPGQESDASPVNPAGEIELSDEELEAVEGGLPEFIKSLNESCYKICKDED